MAHFFPKAYISSRAINNYQKSNGTYIYYCNYLTYSVPQSYAMRYKIVTIEDLRMLSTCL
jgi:hypothetical protein